MAPEIFEQKEYGVEVDMWSLGVILYYMHTLQLPFQAKSMRSMIKQVLTNKYNDDLIRNKPIKTIIAACLKKDPDHRCKIN